MRSVDDKKAPFPAPFCTSTFPNMWCKDTGVVTICVYKHMYVYIIWGHCHKKGPNT